MCRKGVGAHVGLPSFEVGLIKQQKMDDDDVSTFKAHVCINGDSRLAFSESAPAGHGERTRHPIISLSRQYDSSV